MKKITSISIVILLSFNNALACELCKSHQPEMLKEIAHGMGPKGTIDYIIMWSAIVIVLVTLFMSVRFLVQPNKLDKKHSIKFLPVNENH